jgi:hypothetical protein
MACESHPYPRGDSSSLNFSDLYIPQNRFDDLPNSGSNTNKQKNSNPIHLFSPGPFSPSSDAIPSRTESSTLFSVSRTRIVFYITSAVIGNVLAEPIIDALMRGLSHVIFSFGRRQESTACRHRIKPGAKINLCFPAPRKCQRVSPYRGGKDLLPV